MNISLDRKQFKMEEENGTDDDVESIEFELDVDKVLEDLYSDDYENEEEEENEEGENEEENEEEGDEERGKAVKTWKDGNKSAGESEIGMNESSQENEVEADVGDTSKGGTNRTEGDENEEEYDEEGEEIEFVDSTSTIRDEEGENEFEEEESENQEKEREEESGKEIDQEEPVESLERQGEGEEEEEEPVESLERQGEGEEEPDVVQEYEFIENMIMSDHSGSSSLSTLDVSHQDEGDESESTLNTTLLTSQRTRNEERRDSRKNERIDSRENERKKKEWMRIVGSENSLLPKTYIYHINLGSSEGGKIPNIHHKDGEGKEREQKERKDGSEKDEDGEKMRMLKSDPKKNRNLTSGGGFKLPPVKPAVEKIPSLKLMSLDHEVTSALGKSSNDDNDTSIASSSSSSLHVENPDKGKNLNQRQNKERKEEENQHILRTQRLTSLEEEAIKGERKEEEMMRSKMKIISETEDVEDELMMKREGEQDEKKERGGRGEDQMWMKNDEANDDSTHGYSGRMGKRKEERERERTENEERERTEDEERERTRKRTEDERERTRERTEDEKGKKIKIGGSDRSSLESERMKERLSTTTIELDGVERERIGEDGDRTEDERREGSENEVIHERMKGEGNERKKLQEREMMSEESEVTKLLRGATMDGRHESKMEEKKRKVDEGEEKGKKEEMRKKEKGKKENESELVVRGGISSNGNKKEKKKTFPFSFRDVNFDLDLFLEPEETSDEGEEKLFAEFADKNDSSSSPSTNDSGSNSNHWKRIQEESQKPTEREGNQRTAKDEAIHEREKEREEENSSPSLTLDPFSGLSHKNKVTLDSRRNQKEKSNQRKNEEEKSNQGKNREEMWNQRKNEEKSNQGKNREEKWNQGKNEEKWNQGKNREGYFRNWPNQVGEEGEENTVMYQGSKQDEGEWKEYHGKREENERKEGKEKEKLDEPISLPTTRRIPSDGMGTSGSSSPFQLIPASWEEKGHESNGDRDFERRRRMKGESKEEKRESGRNVERESEQYFEGMKVGRSEKKEEMNSEVKVLSGAGKSLYQVEGNVFHFKMEISGKVSTPELNESSSKKERGHHHHQDEDHENSYDGKKHDSSCTLTQSKQTSGEEDDGDGKEVSLYPRKGKEEERNMGTIRREESIRGERRRWEEGERRWEEGERRWEEGERRWKEGRGIEESIHWNDKEEKYQVLMESEGCISATFTVHAGKSRSSSSESSFPFRAWKEGNKLQSKLVEQDEMKESEREEKIESEREEKEGIESEREEKEGIESEREEKERKGSKCKKNFLPFSNEGSNNKLANSSFQSSETIPNETCINKQPLSPFTYSSSHSHSVDVLGDPSLLGSERKRDRTKLGREGRTHHSTRELREERRLEADEKEREEKETQEGSGGKKTVSSPSTFNTGINTAQSKFQVISTLEVNDQIGRPREEERRERKERLDEERKLKEGKQNERERKLGEGKLNERERKLGEGKLNERERKLGEVWLEGGNEIRERERNKKRKEEERGRTSISSNDGMESRVVRGVRWSESRFQESEHSEARGENLNVIQSRLESLQTKLEQLDQRTIQLAFRSNKNEGAGGQRPLIPSSSILEPSSSILEPSSSSRVIPSCSSILEQKYNKNAVTRMVRKTRKMVHDEKNESTEKNVKVGHLCPAGRKYQRESSSSNISLSSNTYFPSSNFYSPSSDFYFPSSNTHSPSSNTHFPSSDFYCSRHRYRNHEYQSTPDIRTSSTSLLLLIKRTTSMLRDEVRELELLGEIK